MPDDYNFNFGKENNNLYLYSGNEKIHLDELVSVISLSTGHRFVSINNGEGIQKATINQLLAALKDSSGQEFGLKGEDLKKIYNKIEHLSDNTRLQNLPFITRLKHSIRSFFGNIGLRDSAKKEINVNISKKLSREGQRSVESKEIKNPIEAFLIKHFMAKPNQKVTLDNPPLEIWGKNCKNHYEIHFKLATFPKEPAQEFILSVTAEGKIIEENTIGNHPFDWKALMESASHEFYEISQKKIFQVTPFQVKIHPIYIQKAPEKVLEEMCQSGKFKLPPFGVDFLTNRLESGAAWDRGGLTRQFVSSLANSLLGNSKKVHFDKSSSDEAIILPTIPYDSPKKEQMAKTYQNLGRLISYANKEPYKLGTVLSGSFFEFIKIYLEHRDNHYLLVKTLAEKNLLGGVDTEFVDFLEEYYQSGVTGNLKKYYAAIVMSEEEPDPSLTPEELEAYFTDINLDPEEVADYFEEQVNISIHPFLKAAKAITSGFDQECLENFSKLPVDDIKTKIQGSFSTDALIAMMECDSENLVIQEKVEWLKERIHNDAEWSKKFLLYVTGAEIIIPGEHIFISPSFGNDIQSNSCSNTFRIPETHIDIGTSNEDLVNFTLLSESDKNKKLFFNHLDMVLGNVEDSKNVFTIK